MAINTQLVTITVDPNGQAAEFQCLLALGDYSQTRGKTEYACMSSNDSSVGLGAITRAPLTFEGLYNEDTQDGQDLLKSAFTANQDVEIAIEFDNATPGGSGTTLEGMFGISNYTMTFPKDGKIGVNFSLEFMEEPTLTPAGLANPVLNPATLDISGTASDTSTIMNYADSLTYTVTSSDEAVCTATITDDTVTVTGVAAGSSTVTVEADNGTEQTTGTISVTVS